MILRVLPRKGTWLTVSPVSTALFTTAFTFSRCYTSVSSASTCANASSLIASPSPTLPVSCVTALTSAPSASACAATSPSQLVSTSSSANSCDSCNCSSASSAALSKSYCSSTATPANVVASTAPNSFSTAALRNFASQYVPAFNPAVPVERATTLPSSWYSHPEFLHMEKYSVFGKSWIPLARVEQLKHAGDYVSGSFLNEPYIIVKDSKNVIRAFYNVCKHHAMLIINDGTVGNVLELKCPYHGWTYNLEGQLKIARRLRGIEEFRGPKITLNAIPCKVVGPFVYLAFDFPLNKYAHKPNNIQNEYTENSSQDRRLAESCAAIEAVHGLLSKAKYEQLTFVTRKSYRLNCNWKIFSDNYLDGGYHVPFAHLKLTSNLELQSYRTEVFKRYSLQFCGSSPSSGAALAADTASPSAASPASASSSSAAAAGEVSRVSGEAIYAFLYPNFMINRYGPWMDTNLIVPINQSECLIQMDYYLDHSVISPSSSQYNSFVQDSLQASEIVQNEDVYLCETVQRGLNSSAYDVGRYAPLVEHGMYDFHQTLYDDVRRDWIEK